MSLRNSRKGGTSSMPPTWSVRDAAHELVADIPIALEVRNLVCASGSPVFEQEDPGISDDGNMTARLTVKRRGVTRVRSHCIHRGRENSCQGDRGCKTLHVTSPIMNGEAVGGYQQLDRR
jgi:hypothetical protein